MDEAILNGLHVAILVTDGFEQIELTAPREALEAEGAITKIISERHGSVQGMHHDKPGDAIPVDLIFDETDDQDFDAVLLPGGEVNSAHIRTIAAAQDFVRGMDEEGKPVAVICHGAWLLVSAGLVQGRTLTSWPSLQKDIENAGGIWVDRAVVDDRNWISSRKPDDIPAFNARIAEVFSARVRAALRGTGDENAAGIASS
ncbi:MAG TPA: type 1 glutamine amidotransferase domain-containing protein [Burkholderiaceae bacterium]